MITLQNCEAAKVALERKESELNRQLSALRVEIIELQDQNVSVSYEFWNFNGLQIVAHFFVGKANQMLC